MAERLQSNLGSVEYSHRTDLDNGGKISLAEVVKVYNKSNSADVRLITNSYMGDNKESNGELACMHVEQFTGWDEERKVAYGDITPLAVGQMVYIAYVDSMKGRPVILGSLQSFKNNFNNCPRKDAENEFISERDEIIRVTRNQDYSYFGGEGEFEKVSSSRAFFVGKKNKMSDRREKAFNYENLTLKNKKTNKTIGLKEEDFDFKPFNFLAVTKNKFKDLKAVFNRFYHDAEKGVTRVSKDTDKQLFYIEVDSSNNFEIRLQRDSNVRKASGDDPQDISDETLRKSDSDLPRQKIEQDSTNNTAKQVIRIRINENGDLKLTSTQDEQTQSEVIIRPDGIDMKSTGTINIGSKSDINIQAPSISVGTKGFFEGVQSPPNVEL